jgi:hypothetical protein
MEFVRIARSGCRNNGRDKASIGTAFAALPDFQTMVDPLTTENS